MLQLTTKGASTTLVNFCVMNVRTDKKTDRIHILYVYVGLTQGLPQILCAYISMNA